MKGLRESPLTLGLVGAVLASTCCATPVLLVTMGLATSSLLLAWFNLKPIFLAIAAVFLVAGLTWTLVRSRRACSISSYRRRLWLYPLVTVLSFGLGYWLIMNVATPQLYARVYASDRAAVVRSGAVVEPGGQIVALRRATFKIYMGCEGCASTLRTVFLGLPGVHAAAIDIQHRTASVLYDPTRINAEILQTKIPYPWYYTPHLSSDVAMVVNTATSTSTAQLGSMLALLAIMASLSLATSAAVWSTSRNHLA